LAGPSVLAHIAIAKFRDHIPLYRQEDIYHRNAVDIDRRLMADWIARMAREAVSSRE
jgi:transposase